jgi:hypothetical protein
LERAAADFLLVVDISSAGAAVVAVVFELGDPLR